MQKKHGPPYILLSPMSTVPLRTLYEHGIGKWKNGI